jgi:hypothetical protein
MEDFRLWSLAKVLTVSGGWVLLCVLLVAAWLLVQFRGLWGAPSAGSGGIGAVSFGLSPIMLAIPFGPPVVLIAAWLVARWS